MTTPIDFYFDFSSPYGYLGAQYIDTVGARYGREVTWRPTLLGVAFKTTGGSPLLSQPLKGDYARRDAARTARLMGVPLTLPRRFPFLSLAAARAFYWLADRDAVQAKDVAKALYHVAFGIGGDISSAKAVAEIAASRGVDLEELLAALHDPAVKERLRAEVDAAIARGVFGSPFFVVDDEPFWGIDHLDQLDRWMATGGW